jgi:hydroxyacyl-ACP dehydratase HTD2-like protein with hotdog domain
MGNSLAPELLARIGSRSKPQTELVTRKDLRKYAYATGQRLRKYLEGDVAPPMFHVALFWPVVPENELSADGVAVDTMFPDVAGKRPLAGGLKIEYHLPIRPGDLLTSTRTLTDIYDKQGSSGTLTFIVVTMNVVNANGDLVLTEKTTRVLR